MRDKYIEVLRKAAEENNGKISYKQYEDQKYSPSIKTISSYFGSWTKALQAAGLKTNEKYATSYFKGRYHSSFARLCQRKQRAFIVRAI
ncbi:homing endonuclease associated repeat-containing protein [Fictibacillus sp. NRS-1165]|uniref:homing endonuclease associated repeat-containing protein n=1 Tax=Fictibacillus sp. NRS-1165 TaxID=3144463 RepID=UPI003D190272